MAAYANPVLVETMVRNFRTRRNETGALMGPPHMGLYWWPVDRSVLEKSSLVNLSTDAGSSMQFAGIGAVPSLRANAPVLPRCGPGDRAASCDAGAWRGPSRSGCRCSESMPPVFQSARYCCENRNGSEDQASPGRSRRVHSAREDAVLTLAFLFCSLFHA